MTIDLNGVPGRSPMEEFALNASTVADDEARRDEASKDRLSVVLTHDADTFYEMNGSNVTTLHYQRDGRPEVAVHSTSEADFLTRGTSMEDQLAHEVALRGMKAGDRVSMLGEPGEVAGYENGDGDGFRTDGFRAARISPGDADRETLMRRTPGGIAETAEKWTAAAPAERDAIARAYLDGRGAAARVAQDEIIPSGLIAQAERLTRDWSKDGPPAVGRRSSEGPSLAEQAMSLAGGRGR